MAKLFNDFGNMLESRQTINWNLKINQFESETRTCVDARYLQEHFWQCSQNMCGRALLAKTFWKCNQNRCGCALLAKTIDESPRLPWSSQSFRVLGLTWNGGKWLADIASNFPVWKACEKRPHEVPKKVQFWRQTLGLPGVHVQPKPRGKLPDIAEIWREPSSCFRTYGTMAKNKAGRELSFNSQIKRWLETHRLPRRIRLMLIHC